jgi:hypothetical protein
MGTNLLFPQIINCKKTIELVGVQRSLSKVKNEDEEVQ